MMAGACRCLRRSRARLHCMRRRHVCRVLQLPLLLLALGQRRLLCLHASHGGLHAD
jgi:hypothetical protein